MMVVHPFMLQVEIEFRFLACTRESAHYFNLLNTDLDKIFDSITWLESGFNETQKFWISVHSTLDLVVVNLVVYLDLVVAYLITKLQLI